MERFVSNTTIFISRGENFILDVNQRDFKVRKTRIGDKIEKKFAMHLTGWPCTWRNYPHVAISARWRHRWCGKSGLSFSFSFEVLIDDCVSLTVSTSITLLTRSKLAASYRILAFAAIVPRSCDVWLTSSSPLRLSIYPRRPGYDVSILPYIRLYFATRDTPIYNL